MPGAPTESGNKEVNHVDDIETGIPQVPVTVERKPYVPSKGDELYEAGVARVNIAPSTEAPYGTTKDNYNERHHGQSVLQQHCAFFDPDLDGVIWPQDTYHGFRDIGFGVFLSLLSTVIIHFGFSYPTVSGILPDPFFRLYLNKIYKAKHGSDTGTFDNEGRYIPQKFEDFFSKYGEGRDGLSAEDIWRGLKGQRVAVDLFGWSAAAFEWLATYLLLWPEDGVIKKEDIRGIYDGSIFYVLAEKNARGSKAGKKSQ